LQCALLLEHGDGSCHVLFVSACVECLYQMLFGAEVVVGVSECYSSLFCYGTHRRLLISTLSKESQGRLQNEGPGLLSFVSLRRLSPLIDHQYPFRPTKSPNLKRFLEIQAINRRAIGMSSGEPRLSDHSRYSRSAHRQTTQAF